MTHQPDEQTWLRMLCIVTRDVTVSSAHRVPKGDGWSDALMPASSLHPYLCHQARRFWRICMIWAIASDDTLDQEVNSYCCHSTLIVLMGV